MKFHESFIYMMFGYKIYFVYFAFVLYEDFFIFRVLHYLTRRRIRTQLIGHRE